tara:strand:- start:144 stop:1073 length:930 start_codon:yes stop_codon:yes gene_type:complete
VYSILKGKLLFKNRIIKFMDIKRFNKNTSPETILKALNEDAAIIIENLVSKDLIKKIDIELKPYLEACYSGKSEFSGLNTRRIGALIARSPGCRDLASNSIVNNVANSFLDPFCDDYQINLTQAVSIGPDEKPQILHRDRGMYGGFIPRKIEPLLGCVWALSEFTKENGATQVVPGSHAWDKDRVPLQEEISYAEMDPGSVLLYTGTVLHGGGSNLTDLPRLGVFIHYSLSWLRQQENQYLSCPIEIAKNLDPELRSLMGYSRAGYVLGYFSSPDEKNNLELVSPEEIFGEKSKYDNFVSPKDLVDGSS